MAPPLAPSRSSAPRRGVALLITLLLVSVLSIISVQFAFSASVGLSLAQNASDDAKIEFAARGALAIVRSALRGDRNLEETAVVDSRREIWFTRLNEPTTIGDVALELETEDCESRLNVNLLAKEETKAFAQAVLLRLATLLELEEAEDIVNRIVDYVDTDTEGDFEDGAKNGPLLSPDELLAIPDVPMEAWFGGGEEGEGLGEALVGVLTGVDDGSAPLEGGLLRFLTAWGTEKLNLNTISDDLFRAILPERDAAGAEIDVDRVMEEVMRFRTGGTEEEPAPVPTEGEPPPGEDFTQTGQLNKIPGLQNIFPQRQGQGGGGGGGGQPGGGGGQGQQQAEPLPQALLTTTSQDFTIRLRATAAGGTGGQGLQRRYEALLRRGEDKFFVLMWRELR